MKLLIIGGTVFVGRHIAEAAIASGHDVTVFHRGTKGTGIVRGATEILGDRTGDLGALTATRWDAVIDSCAYVPRIARLSGAALREATNRYIFISTISVYDIADDGALFVPENPPCDTEEITAETYGRLKVECEQSLSELYGDRLTIVRPGLVAGPHDPTNRFTYWVERFANCTSVLMPNHFDQPIELIDARDLAAETLSLTEAEMHGTFDAVGALSTMGDVYDACHAARPETKRFVFDLSEDEVQLGQELPLIRPKAEGKPWKYESDPLMQMSSTRPIAHRPMLETARDTLTWSYNRDRSVPDRVGMSRAREVEIMDAIKAARAANE